MIEQTPKAEDTTGVLSQAEGSKSGVEAKASIPREPVIITRPATLADSPAWRFVTRPSPVTFICVVLMIALISFGFGASVSASSGQISTGSSGHSMDNMGNMGGMSSTPDANVPDAKEQSGNHLAKYTVEAGGIKHFTFTAQQVMWQPLSGQKVLAWTLDGTVPGPMIRILSEDHVRITIINHLPASTAIHWHGLEVPMNADGVPGLGQDAIQPGSSYTYDFQVHDADIGTHWYHSHEHDLTQVGGGLYGAFIVDPRPGSAAEKTAIHADVEETVFVGMMGTYYVMNGKSFPDTDSINVKQGQTVHIRLIGADVMGMHPMHLHSHTFSIVAEDGHPLKEPILKDTVALAPGETYDLTFKAWAAPGSVFPFHCHILGHLMNPQQQGDEMGGLIMLVKYAK